MLAGALDPMLLAHRHQRQHQHLFVSVKCGALLACRWLQSFDMECKNSSDAHFDSSSHDYNDNPIPISLDVG